MRGGSGPGGGGAPPGAASAGWAGAKRGPFVTGAGSGACRSRGESTVVWYLRVVGARAQFRLRALSTAGRRLGAQHRWQAARRAQVRLRASSVSAWTFST